MLSPLTARADCLECADSVKMRRKTVELGIPLPDFSYTASALAKSLLSRYSQDTTELVDLNRMRKTPLKLSFTKMEATGNDYIYFDCMQYEIPSPESISVVLSNRHFNVGSDGIIMMLPSSIADAKMRMFNRDGTEGKMCGNGIRCVAKYLYENNIVRKSRMTIETLSGVRNVHLYIQNEKVISVTVDMGKEFWIPLRFP